MAKYLIKASYTIEGTKGLLKEGGSSRKAALQKAVEGLGGKLETFYYTFGEADAIAIVDVPDAAAVGVRLCANDATVTSSSLASARRASDQAQTPKKLPGHPRGGVSPSRPRARASRSS